MTTPELIILGSVVQVHPSLPIIRSDRNDPIKKPRISARLLIKGHSVTSRMPTSKSLSQIKCDSSSLNRSDLVILIAFLKNEHDFKLSDFRIIWKTKKHIPFFKYKDVELDFRGRE